MDVCAVVIVLIILAIIGTGLGLYFGLFTKDDIEDKVEDLTGIEINIPTIPPGLFEDEFEGRNITDIEKWPYTGNGLSLEIVNACDSTWDARFNEAVSDWESGTPDALSLTTSRRARDLDCDPEDDIMKVCNDDYGATNWRGINTVLISGRSEIVASVALMNDYYLKDADQFSRQYTMCHEIGHGFGLPHTDEDFNNANQGNCLDYTNRYESNMRPGQINFDRLAQAYGTVSRRDRALRKTGRFASIPDSVLDTYKYHSSARGLSVTNGLSNDGWVTIYLGEFAASHEIDLGDGFVARRTMLLA